MRVLVTGAGGQLGGYLRASLQDAGFEVVGLGSRAADGVDVVADIVDEQRVGEAIADAYPAVVIHAAAYTDVDGCERDPARADAVNHLGSRNVARAANRAGAWVLAIGTDFVFSGEGGAPYDERAEPDPVSHYGASKLAGERAILAEDDSFAVARPSWVFGGANKHFPRTVLTMIRDRGGMTVVDDEISNPTFAGDLADALVQLLPLRPSGILHLTNEGSVSRYDFARGVVQAAGLDQDMIQPTTTAEFLAAYPLPARRPPNSSLANNRAAALGVRLPAWEDAVQRYVPRLARELGLSPS